MTLKLRLSDPDRERLGLPEIVDYDELNLSVEDAQLIDDAGGDWTKWGTTDPNGVKAAVWLALHKLGKPVAWKDLTFNIRLCLQVSPGKAPSGSDEPSTPSPSATSRTGTSRRKK